ncbi:unnamed protein product [Fusarium graminearum]|uniref:Uncharacterized protein n=1 Tax=Gibberella zeae TaxID=5518 RepID=A0A2H3HRW8_GIBZA|nr:hypothetical protein FG05_07271 [Fusarium graminearum]PCD40679.1 hypothetical protein FGRA07_01950 [Fusarium graminearum]CAF3618139.1 unnamed protein product [Fusarium graminearum]CAG1963562.1 unnamed protein product [Fusarium graminearum]CAG1982996.1 unnamed protein product [Fusarium graminearum]
MADENTTSNSSGRPAAGVSSGFNAPPSGQGPRRAMTVSVAEEAASASRRQYPASPSFDSIPPRRSSNFSEYSLNEARDFLNPQPRDPGNADSSLAGESSSLPSLSLAFAFLPAISGLLFKNGSAVVTDFMLLGLAGVFLNWSVTQPWTWYHSAQQVRIQHEVVADSVIDDDSDLDSSTHGPGPNSPLDHVPEDEAVHAEPTEEIHEREPSKQQQDALAELYFYEIIALASCFLLPLLGAYLLHAIRSQLSRPSEGLVSNYNLTIFLLMAEFRALSHVIKLVQSRTLHLQRVVQGGPSKFQQVNKNTEQLETVLARLERLESRVTNDETSTVQDIKQEISKTKQKDSAMARDVRNAIQPELDALNRAVRRYEKKATLLQIQTESRFSGVEARLDDAIALAASAAKNSASHKNVFVWAMESLTAAFLLPFRTLLRIMLLPLSTIFALMSKGKKRNSPPVKSSSRSSRNGKTVVQPKYNGDRVPSRVAKR